MFLVKCGKKFYELTNTNVYTLCPDCNEEMCIRDSTATWSGRKPSSGALARIQARAAAPSRNCLGQRAGSTPVSYTHLDVYKRQA